MQAPPFTQSLRVPLVLCAQVCMYYISADVLHFSLLECVSSFSTMDQIAKSRSNRFCLLLK